MLNWDKVREYAGREAVGFTRVLAASYLMTFLAGYYYLFDLFSHFTLQYMIGGIILGAALLWDKRYKYAALALAVALLCLIESRWHMQEPLRFLPQRGQADYTIATYNHNLAMADFTLVENWLRQTDTFPDIVVLIEATARTVKMGKRLSDIYPYQILEPREHAFGIVVLSRHPFTEDEKIVLQGEVLNNFSIRVTVQPGDTRPPVTIYAMHPPPPTNVIAQAQRDTELRTVAEKIQNDESENIVMLGDWNVTPFAPVFSELLDKSDLNFQSFGLLQNPTWPAFFFAPFLKIPIDHILFSDGLIMLDKQVKPSLMSDHHPVVATFAVK